MKLLFLDSHRQYYNLIPIQEQFNIFERYYIKSHMVAAKTLSSILKGTAVIATICLVRILVMAGVVLFRDIITRMAIKTLLIMIPTATYQTRDGIARKVEHLVTSTADFSLLWHCHGCESLIGQHSWDVLICGRR